MINLTPKEIEVLKTVLPIVKQSPQDGNPYLRHVRINKGFVAVDGHISVEYSGSFGRVRNPHYIHRDVLAQVCKLKNIGVGIESTDDPSEGFYINLFDKLDSIANTPTPSTKKITLNVEDTLVKLDRLASAYKKELPQNRVALLWELNTGVCDVILCEKNANKQGPNSQSYSYDMRVSLQGCAVKESADIYANLKLVRQALKVAQSLNIEELDVWTSTDYNPIIFKGKDFRAMVMPFQKPRNGWG